MVVEGEGTRVGREEGRRDGKGRSSGETRDRMGEKKRGVDGEEGVKEGHMGRLTQNRRESQVGRQKTDWERRREVSMRREKGRKEWGD